MLSKDIKGITEAYVKMYQTEEVIEEEILDEIFEELVAECIEEGFTEEEACSAVEDATNEYLEEAKVTFGHDTAARRASGAPVGARRRYAGRKAGDALKAAGAAAKGAVDTAKKKASAAKAGAQIAGSIAKDEARRAGRAAQHSVTKAADAVKRAPGEAKKKAKSGTFFKIGKVFGRFFWIVSGIWGAVTGFMKGLKRYEDGNLFEKLLGGIAGAFTGIVNILITSLLDLVKDGISWVANKLGFENFSNFLDSFSFEEMFTNLINRITDTIVNTFRTIGDLIQDIGVSGIIRNVTLSLLKIMKKIAMFPVAVAAGGAAALGALLPGGKSPTEAFSETFASVLNFGDDLIDGLKAQADGLNSEGELIDARSEEGIRLREQRELERGQGPAIAQAVYNTQQRAGDVVNYVQSSFDTVRSTAGGVLAKV